MSTLSALLAEYTDLPGGGAVDHLQRVVAEWQLLADLSFADVLLWVNAEPGGIVCVAQCRPTTASTVLPEDSVGTVVSEDEHPYVPKAFESGKIVVADVDPADPIPMRRQACRCAGTVGSSRCSAVMPHGHPGARRARSKLPISNAPTRCTG